MEENIKKYIYNRGKTPSLDAQFQNAPTYGKVKLGTDTVF